MIAAQAVLPQSRACLSLVAVLKVLILISSTPNCCDCLKGSQDPPAARAYKPCGWAAFAGWVAA
jgi:hypothetical protein